MNWGCFSMEVSPSFFHHALTILPFRRGVEGAINRQCLRMTVLATRLLFKAVECFQSERKMKKPHNNSTFLISSKPGCLSLRSCYDNSSSPPPSFGSVSKLRTMNVKDQKVGQARRQSRHSDSLPWRTER